MGIITVLWEKGKEFKRDFKKITAGAVLTPILYLIAFGFGLRPLYEGGDYLRFLVPGLVCMTSMTASFSAVIQNMSVQRLYERALDQVLMSPTPLWQFLMGQVIGGMLRGIYGSVVIMLITLPLNIGLIFNAFSFLILCLNGLVFASFALCLSFLAKSYADAPRFTQYIIMPMTFLCNTFFSAASMPGIIGKILGGLPLSLSCSAVRRIANGSGPVYGEAAAITVYLIVIVFITVNFAYKKKNL